MSWSCLENAVEAREWLKNGELYQDQRNTQNKQSLVSGNFLWHIFWSLNPAPVLALSVFVLWRFFSLLASYMLRFAREWEEPVCIEICFILKEPETRGFSAHLSSLWIVDTTLLRPWQSLVVMGSMNSQQELRVVFCHEQTGCVCPLLIYWNSDSQGDGMKRWLWGIG